MAISSESHRGYTAFGFLPQGQPLEQLPLPFCQWERLLKEAQAAVQMLKRTSGVCGGELGRVMTQWRGQVRQMIVIPFEPEGCAEAVAQRAHHVLTFLVQFYVQSQNEKARSRDPVIRIPASLAVPLVAVSRYLGIAPIVTYADTVLWNWKLIDPEKDVSTTNVRMIDLFTGNSQEEHFFLTSLRMEICGKASIKAMLQTVPQERMPKASGGCGEDGLVGCIQTIVQNLHRLTDIFCAVREGVTPDFFYNDFRPWIQGADQGTESPSWLYEGTGLILQPSGPSAGQSAMMQSFDVFLGIKHPHNSDMPGSGCAYVNSALNPHREVREGRLTAAKCPNSGHEDKFPVRDSTPHCFNHGARSSENRMHCPVIGRSIPPKHRSKDSKMDTSFNARMRTYMPMQHQQYLLWLEEHKPFRAVDVPGLRSQAVSEAHGAAVRALERWRSIHIQIVTQYVILPARRKFCLEAQEVEKAGNSGRHQQYPATEAKEQETRKVVRGTGGTSLIPLLKIYRASTRDAVFRSTQTPCEEVRGQIGEGASGVLWWLSSLLTVVGAWAGAMDGLRLQLAETQRRLQQGCEIALIFVVCVLSMHHSAVQWLTADGVRHSLVQSCSSWLKVAHWSK